MEQLSITELEEVWQRWTSDRRKVDRDWLVVHYLPLVKILAAKMARSVEPSNRPDLYGYASIGLMDAIDRFDPAVGVKFETYGSRRINGAMGDGLRTLSYFPRGAEKRASRVIEKIVPVDFQSAMTTDGARLDETLTDRLEEGPDALSDLASDHSEVVKALVHLPERERMVISQHYYLKKPLKEIGLLLGVTESRVCQIHRHALSLLEEVLTERLSA
ncbi:MAG: sigma-70 family RNA polymerase sigma factor [Actinobacteria bacterium]|nr:sigma-70 family RNA polymerase sigma factor [Actinomycetota bacterium]